MFKRNKRGLELSKEQIDAKNLIIDNLQKGIYKEEPLTCICGNDNYEVIAKEDRYGIPIQTVICKNCGMIYSNPYYDNDTLTDFYTNHYRALYQTKEYSDKQFESRKQSGIYYVNQLEKKYNEHIQDKKVFEIGCAAGAILQAFKDRGCNVYGCDYGKKYLEFGRNKGLTLEDGSYESLKQYGQADILILSHVLEHIVRPIDFLKDIKQLLKDDGYLLIVLPIIENISKVYQSDIFRYIQNAHVYNFSVNTTKYVAKCSGYECELLDRSNGIFIFKKANSICKIEDIDKKEYKYAKNILITNEILYNIKKIIIRPLENIFSIKNFYIDEKRIKQITIMGLKIKINKS